VLIFAPIREGINMKMILVVGMVVVLGTGCRSVKPVDVNRGLSDYYNQPRTVDLVCLKGTNMTISMSGVSELRVASILPPLNAIPREPGITEKVIDGVVGLGKWGLGWYYGSQMMATALEQPRTVDPLVVEPTVVTVPAE
jgi:hypothetical protein